MQKSILVISNKWDAHANAVIKEIQKHGGSVVRINTEDFRQNEVYLFLEKSSSKWKIITPEQRIISEETISGVYIRRIGMPIDVSDIDSQFQNFTRSESTAFLNAIETLLENKIWLNRPHERNKASNKIRQLLFAQEVGLDIPKTLITNNCDFAKQFCNKRAAIYKVLESPMLDLGDAGQSMINTSIVPKSTDFSSANLSPALFQNYIPKAYELRIHIIDKNITPIKINSQEHPEAQVDWRIAQRDLHYELVILPKDIELKLLLLMDRLEIRFGIVDMIVTKGGNYVFLEINPDGNWLWIEQKIHTPISESIAFYFLNKGEKP
jgi:glutathione synthase/RimK-type ligase-like ATP-grasp enzyme